MLVKYFIFQYPARRLEKYSTLELGYKTLMSVRWEHMKRNLSFRLKINFIEKLFYLIFKNFSWNGFGLLKKIWFAL